MGKAIPLPRYEELPEVVLFHRNHPADTRLLLQVPTGSDAAETFIIDLAQPVSPPGEYDPRTDHRGWVKRLPNSRGLMDKLACDPHVAYYHSRGGAVMVLEDPDTVPWVRQVMALARQETATDNSLRSRLAHRSSSRGNRLGQSPLRRALGARPGGASW